MNLNTALRLATLATVSLAVLVNNSSVICQAQDPTPSPLALLRAAEAARTSHPSVEVELEIAYLSPPPERKIQCLIEMSGDKRRFEVLEGDVPGQVVIRDSDLFHQYRKVKHDDIEVFDVKMATGSRGTLAFDPRVLGLSDTMLCNIEVRNCLWYENSDTLEVVGSESIHGATAWRVKATRGSDTAEFWIEEPSFRVHRKVVKTEGLQIEIDSEFDNPQILSPFPSKVSIVRTAQEKSELRYSVKKFIQKDTIDPGRFAMKSLGAPRGTAISDYRTSQISGYWDGDGVSKSPVSPTGESLLSADSASAPKNKINQLMIWVNVGVVCLVAGAIVFNRYRMRRRTS